MTPEFVEAALEGRREEAVAALGAEVPEDFPSEGDRGFLGMRLRQMREDERFLTWCPYALVLDGQMIGHAGYHGPPGVNSAKNPAAVEFGYQVFPAWRGRGYASRAAEMLMEIARERGIHDFALSCAPDNEPSLAIIRKLGFVRTGEQVDDEDGLEHVFELRSESAAETGA